MSFIEAGLIGDLLNLRGLGRGFGDHSGTKPPSLANLSLRFHRARFALSQSKTANPTNSAWQQHVRADKAGHLDQG
jgi:hypothetical protein